MWELALRIIAAFGGLVAIAGVVAAVVSKVMSDRVLESHKSALQKEVERLKADLAKEQETHKLVLKRKEILFSREIDAAKAFFELHQKISPTYSFPDKEWTDVVDDMLGSLGEIETELSNFVRDHGPFLPKEIRALVDQSERLASDFKFFSSGHGTGNQKQAEEAVDKILENLREVKEQFVALLQH